MSTAGSRPRSRGSRRRPSLPSRLTGVQKSSARPAAPLAPIRTSSRGTAPGPRGRAGRRRTTGPGRWTSGVRGDGGPKKLIRTALAPSTGTVVRRSQARPGAGGRRSGAAAAGRRRRRRAPSWTLGVADQADQRHGADRAALVWQHVGQPTSAASSSAGTGARPRSNRSSPFGPRLRRAPAGTRPTPASTTRVGTGELPRLLDRRGQAGVVGGRLEEAQVERDDPRGTAQQLFQHRRVIRARVPAVVRAQLGDGALVDGDQQNRLARVGRDGDLPRPADLRGTTPGCARQARGPAPRPRA